jgi:hypothetical protein
MTDTVRLAAALLGKAKDADAWADSYKGQRLEAWMRGFAHVARLAATVLEKCPKVVDLGDDAALSAPAVTDMREALARQVANARPGHDSLGAFGPDGLVLYVSREQRDTIVAALSAPHGGERRQEDVRAIREALDLFQSAIKCGETWTGTCEAVNSNAREALQRLAAASPPPAIGEEEIAQAVMLADGCGLTVNGERVLCDDARAHAAHTQFDDCQCRKIARAVLALVNRQQNLTTGK